MDPVSAKYIGAGLAAIGMGIAAIGVLALMEGMTVRRPLADAAGRRWYTDPLFLGHYPTSVLEELGGDAPVIHPGDMELISTPIDYLGVNYYSRQVISAQGPVDTKTSGLPLTEMGWEIYAQGLTDLLMLLHQDYKLPAVLITENGGAFKDPVTNGRVHDADRTDYLRTHIAAMADAMDQGVPMAGYMVWSLMDNFEWASGYAKRFGIVHVDYATQKRSLKDSALWYQRFLHKRQLPVARPVEAVELAQAERG